MKIKILHLFPDLLNLYGDKGNIECMRKRLVWRGIDAEVITHTCLDKKLDLSDIDIVFIGGGSDREQKIVCDKLLAYKKELKDYVENNGTLVAVCGRHTPLGKVVYGYGNDEKTGYEGVVYKNVVATYLHGPLLPKNPALCDYILTNAVRRKKSGFIALEPLEDALEKTANEYIVNRFKRK